VDAVVVEVEAEGLGASLAEGERGGGFGRIEEPNDLGEPARSVLGLDVAQHPARADRGELPVVADEPDAASPADHVVDGAVEAEGVGHAGLVDDDQAAAVVYVSDAATFAS
jgi:hypothetical protein